MHLLRVVLEAHYGGVMVKWTTDHPGGGGGGGDKKLISGAVKGRTGAEGCEKVALRMGCLSLHLPVRRGPG